MRAGDMTGRKTDRLATFAGTVLIWFCLLAPVSGVRAGQVPAEPQAVPKILLISSFHLSHKWTSEVNNAIIRELDQMPETPIVDYLELNAVRNRSSDFIGKFEPYRRAIRERKYDLVVAILDDAINLLIKNLDSVPPDQPIVFCGYQELIPGFTRLHPNITGVAVDFQVLKTIEMGLALMPDTEEIAVVTDDFPSGMQIHQRLQAEAADFKRCRLTLINGAQYSTSQMLEAVRSMPEKSFVVFCPWRNYARDGYSSLLNVGRELEKTGRPYLVITDVLLGQGALGGCMSRGATGGREMAQLIRRILKNNHAAAIPFVHDNGEFVADMAVMKKFNLPASRLPAGTLTVNRDIPLWESHREAVAAAAAALFLLTALVAALVIIHIRFRRISRRMREEQESLIARLDNHVGNEQIINQCLQQIIIAEDSGEAVRRMLGATGSHIGADRAYIFQYRDGRFVENIYEWTAPGISPQIDRLRHVDMNEFPLLQNIFQEKRSMEIADTRQPATELRNIADFILTQEVRSVRLCGIWEQGKLWGFMGMDFVRSFHSFSESDRKLLDNAVNLFLLARERRRQMREISDGAFLQKQIFDSVAIPIVMFDLDYNITVVNPASCHTIGRQPGELLGRKCYHALCGHDAPPEWCPMRLMLEDHQSHRINFHGHGDHHYQVTLQPIFNRDRQLTGALENALDITDLFKQKQEQEVTNVFLKRAGEIAEIIYFKGNAAGKVSLLGGNLRNAGTLKDNGEFVEWLLAEDRPAFLEEKKALVEGRKEVLEFVCRATAVSGEIRTYQLYATAYSRRDDIYLGILQDVTEAVKATAEKNDLILKQKAYVENEKIINACLTQLVQDENFDLNINHILKTLAKQLDSDRAYYGRYEPDGSYEITHEWLNAGVSSLLEVRDPRFKEQFSIWRRRFQNNELLEIPDIRNSRYAEVLREPGCRTLLCAPVAVNQRLHGIVGLGFIRHRRNISEFDENMIRSVAQIISLGLQRDARHRELKEAISDREAIFRNISMPIMFFDRTVKLTRVNPAVCNMVHKSEAEILAEPCHGTFCRQAREPAWCPVRQALKNGKDNQIEICLNGREYVIKAEPVLDENGEIRNIIESAVDVTEINESKRQLEKGFQAEQAANRAKSYFIASISHEIRTPLNAVIGFSELLKDGGLSAEEQLEYLNSISLAGNSLLQLINDVLDLSRLEAEQTVLTPQPTDLMKLLREVQAIFQYKAQQKNIFFRLDCPGNLPLFKLDSLRLRQILLNLVGNAVKFTERGGIAVNTEFSPAADCSAGMLTVSVLDTGAGIPAAVQKKIFNPFEQSDVIRDTHIHGGTGLGLAISRRLAERMNGEITLESQVGRGSCFTLVLKNVEIAVAEHISPEEKRIMPPETLRNPRVLLVDDVMMNLKVLEAMLRKLQIGCIMANSGPEALRLLAEDRDFTLILTDLWMPGMNGTELARKIHANPATAGIPIVVVTADSQISGDGAEEFQDVLLKPITLEKLQIILRRNQRPTH
ncbi:ABC transporter substrate binding protein [Victivallis sp. Marseille-Q1083]|uniref:ABC transporter substrate binding protein n=1 Tax=Victivallis sp. Marseille-Q1083 TaxID=2717288 RepID=UPI00158EF177|nr:ABC transporter substrate binding protein [Victivallis sp. Marseille-Q1083]